MAWSTSIFLNDSTTLQDVRLTNPANNTPLAHPEKAPLRFLSIVETARIPLHLSLGTSWKVTTSDDETERWFGQIFATAGAGEGTRWWEDARPDSVLGILVGAQREDGVDSSKGPRVTEVLFYATRSEQGAERLPTPPPSSPDGAVKEGPTLTVHALALSSDLLHAAEQSELTPPSSPTAADEDFEAVFLPQPFPPAAEIVNEPPVRKRKSAADAFDEAHSRRQKARRSGGQGVSAAAAAKTECQRPPTLKHSRSVSGPHVPLQTRPLSRSPSLSSSRPPTAVPAAAKRSGLSQVQGSADATATATETKNKDFISRIVMAGMRLHGLSQSKARGKSKADSIAASPAPDEVEAKGQRNEEFKLIYHQVFKGTCFAFRRALGTQALHTFAEQVREVVEKSLGLFCGDPLAEGLTGSGGDEVTPGGRKAFGSGDGQREEEGPFLKGAGAGMGAGAGTPSLRDKGDG